MTSRCPCGSGKKRKLCCEKPSKLPPPHRVNGFYVDHRIKKIVIITKDILRKQFNRDTPKIALSFDKALGIELDQVSEVVASTLTILSPRLIGRDLADKAREATCARLLSTATTTFLGCIHLARGGYRLQYMALSRSVLETICTVLHIVVDSAALHDFHAGVLKSTKSVTASNRVLPGFSRMWGDISNQFVHINTMHSSLNPLIAYKQDDEDLSVIKLNMRMLAWLLFVAAELTFVEDLDRTRYWKLLRAGAEGNEVQYNPSEQERAWQAAFFGYDSGQEDGTSSSS